MKDSSWLFSIFVCTHSPLRRTTEFCVVVPIEEDLEEDGGSSVPAQPPVRTDMAKRHSSEGRGDSRKVTVDMEEVSVPLPGTPTSDDDEQGPPPSSSRLSGQLVLNLDVEQSHDSPDSPVSSHSFSSRGSTKSTDVLLPDK